MVALGVPLGAELPEGPWAGAGENDAPGCPRIDQERGGRCPTRPISSCREARHAPTAIQSRTWITRRTVRGRLGRLTAMIAIISTLMMGNMFMVDAGMKHSTAGRVMGPTVE